MDEVRLKNFRCFRDRQTARLAPLTLLVGGNSTGKTSFLALIRALWDAAYVQAVPDFKEPPYDLGSFDEIVHNRSRRVAGTETIEAGVSVRRLQEPDPDGEHWEDGPYRVDVTFVRQGTFPVPAKWRLARGAISIEERIEGESRSLHYRTPNGEWQESRPAPDPLFIGARTGILGNAVLDLPFAPFHDTGPRSSKPTALPWNGPSSIDGEDREQLRGLIRGFRGFDLPESSERPFAGAPVRSKPRRTYDPARPVRDRGGRFRGRQDQPSKAGFGAVPTLARRWLYVRRVVAEESPRGEPVTRLAVCAEGPTEGEFTNRVLAPHLRPMGVEVRPVVVGRARTPRNGGNVTIERPGTDMAHLYYSFDVVTSLVDFYGFRDKGERRIDELEADLRRAVARRVGHGWDRRKVVPYIQRHEFEGLLFSDVEAFARQRDFPSACVVALRAIRAAFKTPEDINDNRRTAPSKRIKGVIDGCR